MVEGRLAIEERIDPEGNPHTSVHILPEAAQPGDYVVLTIVGVAQVLVDPGTTITPGTRLAVTGGIARPLQSVTMDGVSLAENATTLGTALEAITPGKATIAVLVSLR